jgi:hypothetical protein
MATAVGIARTNYEAEYLVLASSVKTLPEAGCLILVSCCKLQVISVLLNFQNVIEYERVTTFTERNRSLYLISSRRCGSQFAIPKTSYHELALSIHHPVLVSGISHPCVMP